ncbi:MAG: hypothetical protein UH241_08190, partial [Acutalibacteraceae bacterium]|nr:hypothetical protein [Acutalibacteraceae bacterium]
MKRFKKLTALLLAVMLVFSMCVSAVSVSAATESDGTKVVYLLPNANWKQSDARFALYVFGNGDAWASMTDEDGDGYYEGTIPEGDWTGIIFVRMNPATTANNWNTGTKWNQTADLTVPDDANCYAVTEGAWDKGAGTWGHFVPGTEMPTEPPVVYDYTVAGDIGLTGASWDPSANPMTDEDGDGVYTITFADVAAGSYGFKVTDGTWANSWGANGGNYTITLSAKADVTVNFDSATKEITVVSDGLGSFVLNYIAVVGNGVKGSAWLNGEAWNTATKTNVLTEVEKGVWSITYENVAAAEDYQCKFIANDSYTYNWTSDGAFDGQINPNIVVAYDNSTVTLTIDVSAYDFATKTGTVKTNVEVIPPADAPTEGPTEPTEPVEVDYYLFGYINGANYGDGDDYENMGNYKFVDGTVTATFEQDSYVGVKTTGNATWYMTDGWAGNVTSVTLYDTKTLDTTADKLMVPAGKVTFTLVANEDGTLTLSYVVVERPTEAPTQAPTEAPTAAPVVKTDGYYVVGDINLKLTACGTGRVRGTIALQAGTYN